MTQNSSVGIDVSKSTLDVSVIQSNKCYHRKFKNTPDGISKIKQFILENNVDLNAQVVMESTGDYHLLVAYKLSKNFNVKIINPLISKQFINTSVRKVKTDKVDSKHLAEIGLKQILESPSITTNTVLKRKLVSLIDTLEKHKAALKLSTKNTKKTLLDFGLEIEFIKELEYRINDLDKLIAEANRELREIVQNQEIIQNSAQIKGVTQESITKIVAIIEDREFKNKRALVAFSGLDISVRESGLWSGRTRISKRGNSQLRKYLVQLAWGLLMHNEYFQSYIEKYKKAGRKYMELLVILARKFLKMLYGSMRSDNVFRLELV